MPLLYISSPPNRCLHISWVWLLLIMMLKKKDSYFSLGEKKSHSTNFCKLEMHYLSASDFLNISFSFFLPAIKPSFLKESSFYSWNSSLDVTVFWRWALFPQKSKQGDKNKVTQRMRKYVFLGNKRFFHSVSKTKLWTFLNVNTVQMAKGISSMSIKGLKQ